jgi:hypothetical protein
MTIKRERRQWMIDDPDLPQSINTEDVLTRLPSGDKLSVSAFMRAAFYFVLEERGQPIDLSQDEFRAWFETEFDDPREFFEWIKDLDTDGQEKLRHLALTEIGCTEPVRSDGSSGDRFRNFAPALLLAGREHHHSRQEVES